MTADTTLKPGSFREVTWDDVRLDVAKLAPDIFSVIEDMSPDSSYKLYEATYPYGAQILDDEGVFNIFVDDELCSINNEKVSKEIREQLTYHIDGMPLGMVCDGTMQLSYGRMSEDEYPCFTFPTKSLFATRAALDMPEHYQAAFYWRMHAGVSDAYMLASLANKEKFMRLQAKYDVDLEPPQSQREHGKLFREIANSENSNINWKTRLLLFGEKWVETLQKNDALRLVLLDRTWRGTALDRNIYTLDGVWDDFVLKIRNKKVDRYILTVARHIIEASIGKAYSYQIAPLDDSDGPFYRIAQIIKDDYGLNKYAPVVMTPSNLRIEERKNLYVSIQIPTINAKRVYASKNNFLMSDFREIHYVINKFIESIQSAMLEQTPLYNLKNYSYNFFSGDKDRMGYFKSGAGIFDNDENISAWLDKNNNIIDDKNPFMRACVRIKLEK